jgi:hypothetical protein
MQFDALRNFDPVSDLQEKVRQYIAHYNITQKQLALMVGCSDNSISDFLLSKRDLRAEVFGRLSKLVENPLAFTNPNRGARIVSAQVLGKQVNGVLSLDRNIESARESHTKQLQKTETITAKYLKVKRGEEITL